jgi:hypothetical protein
MRRILLLALVAGVLVAIPAAASGQPTTLSSGCAELNNPAYDAVGNSVSLALTSQTYFEGEDVTVDFEVDIDGTGLGSGEVAELSLAVGGQFNNPLYQIIRPEGDVSLSHVFTGAEDGIAWFLLSREVGRVTVECVGALDSDGDGVPDVSDVCPATVLPDTPTDDLKRNRFAANSDGVFVDARGALSGYTLADTGGCSATQIIAEAGLGDGHTRFGITRSALEAWIAGLT